MNVPVPGISNIKTYAIIAVVVLVIIIGIAYYFYSQGANKTKITPLTQDNPNSNSPTNNPAGISDADVKMLATNIYNEISGYNIWGHDEAPYEQLLALSDTDFERVYNAYNTLYQSQSGKTLAAQVQSEYVLDDPAWDTSQAAMEDRFSKLNLT